MLLNKDCHNLLTVRPATAFDLGFKSLTVLNYSQITRLTVFKVYLSKDCHHFSSTNWLYMSHFPPQLLLPILRLKYEFIIHFLKLKREDVT